MTFDPLSYMPDLVKMKSQCLSRRLAKEKTQCPGCKKVLQEGTLAWSHRCKVQKNVPEEVVRQRLQKMRDDAAKSFKQRQEAQNSSNIDAIDTIDTTQTGSE
jgi:predicted Fe-S protein YdhL (DUF1289 family)